MDLKNRRIDALRERVLLEDTADGEATTNNEWKKARAALESLDEEN
jgi:hypothetical protein